MGKLYLHIGTPKTGTSAIQVFMAKNRNLLKKKGYSYPDFGLKFEGIGANRNAHFLVQRYFDSKKKRDYKKESELQEKGFSLLLQNLDKYENVVISDEGIWNGFEFMDNFWKNLYTRVTEAGHEIKVIVYVRRQDTFIQSYWAQQVKETSQLSFKEYMEEKRYEKCHLQYDVSLGKIAEVVGRENMIVRVYEKGQYYGKNPSLISDFLHVIGLELTEEYQSSDAIVNRSIDGKCLEIKRILNNMPEFKQKRGFIVDYMREVSQKESKSSDYSRAACFLPEQKEAFLNLFAKGNEIVAKEYLNKPSGVLFEEKDMDNGGEIVEYTKEELVLTCGELLLAMEKQLKMERRKNVMFKKLRKKIRALKKK